MVTEPDIALSNDPRLALSTDIKEVVYELRKSTFDRLVSEKQIPKKLKSNSKMFTHEGIKTC